MKENRSLEFKSDITNTFLKTVSAYANYGNGRILFGVDDDGNPVGLADTKQTCLDIENRINDSISPKPDYELEIEDKKNIVILRVNEGNYKPYLYRSKAYKRNDTATIEVDRLELTELILEGRNLTFDEISQEGDELDFDYLQKKLKQTIGISELTDDILKTLGFYTKDHHFNNAAALFADCNSFHGIDIAKFGDSINYILERQTFSEESILKQYDEAVEMYRRYYQFEVVNGIERKKVEMIPENAFREAIANALVHRDWIVPAHIRVAMFTDHIEISSPGGLPRGMTKEDYLSGHVSIVQNPIIGNLFFRMHLIEQFGTGIQRIKESYLHNIRKPKFEITETSISVVLPVLNNNDISEDEKKVFALIEKGREISSSETAEETGFGKSKATLILKSLVDKGYAEKVGNGRGTRYRKL